MNTELKYNNCNLSIGAQPTPLQSDVPPALIENYHSVNDKPIIPRPKSHHHLNKKRAGSLTEPALSLKRYE